MCTYFCLIVMKKIMISMMVICPAQKKNNLKCNMPRALEDCAFLDGFV